MRFAYDAKQRPTLLLKLQGSASSLDAMALVDSGADVNRRRVQSPQLAALVPAIPRARSA